MNELLRGLRLMDTHQNEFSSLAIKRAYTGAPVEARQAGQHAIPEEEPASPHPRHHHRRSLIPVAIQRPHQQQTGTGPAQTKYVRLEEEPEPQINRNSWSRQAVYRQQQHQLPPPHAAIDRHAWSRQPIVIRQQQQQQGRGARRATPPGKNPRVLFVHY